jgi:hypothetical protein
LVRKQLDERSRESLGALTSLGFAVALLVLLHRALRPAEVPRDALLLGLSGFLEAPDYALLLAVAAACGGAVMKKQRGTVTTIQLYALAFGLLLTQYRLGFEVRKFDPRVLLGITSGVTPLYASYLCLMAHAAIWIRRRKELRCAA